LSPCEANASGKIKLGLLPFLLFFTSAGTFLAEHSAARASPGGFFLPVGDKVLIPALQPRKMILTETLDRGANDE
jgi:hypothetical protein